MTSKMQTATCEGYETPTMKAKAYILYIFVYFVGIMFAMGFKMLFIYKLLALMIPFPWSMQFHLTYPKQAGWENCEGT